MSNSNERTSLLRSNGGHGAATAPPSFYFLQRGNTTLDRTSHSRDSDGGDGVVLEAAPNGAYSEGAFAPRELLLTKPIIHSSQNTNTQERSFWQRLVYVFGGNNNNNSIVHQQASSTSSNYEGGDVGTLQRNRKVPIKVEPKVYFANERTFLAWMHASVLLAGASVAIVAFADSDSNPWSQLYGIILLPVAIAFILYSMYQYARRTAMIRRKDPGPYEDTVGPTVLGVMLIISIVAQFGIKVYSLM